jgi:uncharacterized protein
MRNRVIAVLASSLALASAACAPALASTVIDKPPSITVIGTGRVKAKPDEAALQMGVVTTGKTASEALSANNKAMAGLMATLAQHNIQERDVQTANFSVYPEYRRPEPIREPNVEMMPMPTSPDLRVNIIGYRVSNEVRVRIRQVSDLGKLLDAVVNSGANNVNSIAFTFSNPESLLSEARAKAVADAKRKADQYAAAAGTKAGKVLYIDEQNNLNQPYPVPNAGFTSMTTRDGEAVSIASGEQEIGTTVTVVYAIE